MVACYDKETGNQSIHEKNLVLSAPEGSDPAVSVGVIFGLEPVGLSDSKLLAGK